MKKHKGYDIVASLLQTWRPKTQGRTDEEAAAIAAHTVTEKQGYELARANNGRIHQHD
jgi:hypothetical protein